MEGDTAAVPLSDPEFRTDIERMLVYHSWARGKYLDLFERLPWRVLTRKRGATFESIRNVHLHVLEVYALWLHSYFHQKQLGRTVRALDPAKWSRIRSVGQLREINRALDLSVQAVARRLWARDFDRKATDIWTGVPGAVTPREVLWHLIEEDFLHHGEILCMLWQDDIEPPYTGIWWFEYDRAPERHQDLWFSNPKAPRPSAGGYVHPKRRRSPRQKSRRRS